MNEKIGLIVDGEGDYAAFKKRFPSFKVLKTDGPRSHTAAVHKIASQARKQISILEALECRRIIVVMDFEGRNVRYTRFLSMTENLFRNLGKSIPVSVAIPNRMIENWYLADIEFLSKQKSFIRSNIKQRNYEGTDGKKELKRCFIKKVAYSETKHGPQIFIALRLSVARKNSASFDHFLRLLKAPATYN
ncbi:hypothetical protein ES703_122050 [subsurface metagenome]